MGLTLGSREFSSLIFNLITVFILIASSGACHESGGQRETDQQREKCSAAAHRKATEADRE